MLPILKLLRPKQWAKNLLVFAALIFAGQANQSASLIKTLIAFAAVSLISSASYIYNDLKDREADMLHPKKKLRPIAAGTVKTPVAIVLFLICLFVGFGLAYQLGEHFVAVLGVFALIQALYNLAFKSVPILDICTIARAFVMRAYLGGAALNVAVSGWLLTCTGMLALLLASAKRRGEFLSLGANTATRKSLSGYNEKILDALVLISAALAAMNYTQYGIESQTAKAHPELIATVPVVFYGIFRYLYLVFQNDQGEEPESIIFSDPHIIITLILFVLISLKVMIQ